MISEGLMNSHIQRHPKEVLGELPGIIGGKKQMHFKRLLEGHVHVIKFELRAERGEF